MAINRHALGAASLIGLLPATALAQKKLVLRFAQVGVESGWRAANTESIRSSAKAAGIDLKFSDAPQKQEKQIKAIRSCSKKGRKAGRWLVEKINDSKGDVNTVELQGTVGSAPVIEQTSRPVRTCQSAS
jgi:GMP synthase PP-ATPase subunit